MNGVHMLGSYDEELDRLRSLLSQMAGLAERLLGDAVTALLARDIELAQKAIAADAEIDRLEAEAEALAIETIARRAPLADDLRELVSAIKIANALERIGDNAKNIARRSTVLIESDPVRQVSVLPEMSNEARHMLRDVLDALIARDSARAIDVWLRDERIDQLYDSLFRELLTHMMENPQRIGVCTHLLFMAKNIERIGDQATNIAELAYYVIEGRPLRDERPRADLTPYMVIGEDKDRTP
ncbi:MAG: phosphate signaling complex protein PhoU [Rhodothalassiaceae bacterium]